MKIQKVTISEHDRKLLSLFMGEECPVKIDYNWLMPVVEKIEQVWDVVIDGNDVKMMKNPYELTIHIDDEKLTKIEAILRAATMFVSMYIDTIINECKATEGFVNPLGVKNANGTYRI